MPSDKKVILCADDFGISPSVSKSICALAEKKRISAKILDFPISQKNSGLAKKSA